MKYTCQATAQHGGTHGSRGGSDGEARLGEAGRVFSSVYSHSQGGCSLVSSVAVVRLPLSLYPPSPPWLRLAVPRAWQRRPSASPAQSRACALPSCRRPSKGGRGGRGWEGRKERPSTLVPWKGVRAGAGAAGIALDRRVGMRVRGGKGEREKVMEEPGEGREFEISRLGSP